MDQGKKQKILAELDALVKKSEKEECASLCSLLGQKQYDKDIENEMSIIYAVLSVYLRPEDSKKPFIEYPNIFSINNFTDIELNFLEIIYTDIASFEIKARFADILWIRRRNPEIAKIAVYSYIEQAKKIEDFNRWVNTFNNIERALRLAALFKRTNIELFDFVIFHIESVLDKTNAEDPLFLSIKLMQLLIEYNQGDPQKYYNIAQKGTQIKSDKENKDTKFHVRTEYWKLCVEWAKKLKDDTLLEQAKIAKAECFANESISIIENDPKQAIMAAHRMQTAVELYKQVKGEKERKEELYRLLREYQKTSMKYLGTIGTPIDVSDMITQTVERLKGLSIREALLSFCFSLTAPVDFEKLEQSAKEVGKEFLFSRLVSFTHMDAEGKVIAKTPPLTEDPDNQEKSNWAEMLRQLRIEHFIKVSGVIEPAREYLFLNYYLIEKDFLDICTNNPFIKNGQEYIFAKGLYAGFTGDFITATHILVPLLENSLRYLLEQYGVNASSVNTHGTQEVQRLNWILDHDKTIEIFGSNLVKELKAILIEPRYGNLRNDLAHGLTVFGTYYMPYVEYLWWLIFRLCLSQYDRNLEDKK